MQKKSYKITFELKEGYSPRGRRHTPAQAEKIIAQWMAQRLKEDMPIVNGFLQDGKLIYPAVAPGHRKNAVTIAHSCIYYGELSSPEDMKRKDKEVRATLESLAATIKQRFKQVSVFIIYRDRNWCV